MTPDEAAAIAGTTYGPLDPDEPLPWGFIHSAYDPSVLRKAYDVTMGRLREGE